MLNIDNLKFFKLANKKNNLYLNSKPSRHLDIENFFSNSDYKKIKNIFSINELNCSLFFHFLERLTGIKGLMSYPLMSETFIDPKMINLSNIKFPRNKYYY